MDKEIRKGATVVADPLWTNTGDLNLDGFQYGVYVGNCPQMLEIMKATYPGGLRALNN